MRYNLPVVLIEGGANDFPANNDDFAFATQAWSSFIDFAGNSRGAVAFISAAMLVFVGATGLAVDAARGYLLKAAFPRRWTLQLWPAAKVLLDTTVRDADIQYVLRCELSARNDGNGVVRAGYHHHRQQYRREPGGYRAGADRLIRIFGINA